MITSKSNMYASARTWNPFKGCKYDCSYCRPSFQLQAKRQKHNCDACYRYEPHEHPERLGRIPRAEIVFVCGNGDVAFCGETYFREILRAIKDQNGKDEKKGFERVYYLQSKRPAYLSKFIHELPPNAILVTTLETNRDDGYGLVSKAPPPSERYRQFKALQWPRKVVTCEPILDFDLDVFIRWIVELNPEYVWLGFNSRPKSVKLSEPSEAKVQELADALAGHGIEVRGKTLRGVKLHGEKRGVA